MLRVRNSYSKRFKYLKKNNKLMKKQTKSLNTCDCVCVRQELMKDRTVLIIAHRLSTIKNSDCIFVIDVRFSGMKTYHKICCRNKLLLCVEREDCGKGHTSATPGT